MTTPRVVSGPGRCTCLGPGLSVPCGNEVRPGETLCPTCRVKDCQGAGRRTFVDEMRETAGRLERAGGPGKRGLARRFRTRADALEAGTPL